MISSVLEASVKSIEDFTGTLLVSRRTSLSDSRRLTLDLIIVAVKKLHAWLPLLREALATAKGEEVPIHISRTEKKEKHDKQPKASSDELKTEAELARARMDSELLELRNRLTPGYMARSFLAGMKHHPMRALIVTAATTGLGGLIYWRKSHLNHAADLKRRHLKRRAWLFKLKHA